MKEFILPNEPGDIEEREELERLYVAFQNQESWLNEVELMRRLKARNSKLQEHLVKIYGSRARCITQPTDLPEVFLAYHEMHGLERIINYFLHPEKRRRGHSLDELLDREDIGGLSDGE